MSWLPIFVATQYLGYKLGIRFLKSVVLRSLLCSTSKYSVILTVQEINHHQLYLFNIWVLGKPGSKRSPMAGTLCHRTIPTNMIANC
ncbi:MAG: hypothetical protein QNJ36_00065 [Calothrix sp. MO_167.B42]|nr:hypothetical protein [Calothrix sp. MO_167.B42]